MYVLMSVIKNIQSNYLSIKWKNIYRFGPAQDVYFALILWYVAKIISLS